MASALKYRSKGKGGEVAGGVAAGMGMPAPQNGQGPTRGRGRFGTEVPKQRKQVGLGRRQAPAERV